MRIVASFLVGTFLVSNAFGAELRYDVPPGGWAYTYAGDQAGSVPDPGGSALDGTWRNDVAFDSWDGLGRGPGVGQPGGVETVGGVLTIEDAVSDLPFEPPGNHRIYFVHEVAQEDVTMGNWLDQGVTLSFRARLTPSSQELAAPDGYGIFANGKGNFGVRQAGLEGFDHGIISFSLVRGVEDVDPFTQVDFGSAGLTMNRLNGDEPTARVNSSSEEGFLNLLPLDVSVFHDFWITIRANDLTPGNGTHTVDIYTDNSLTPTSFNITAGTGNEGFAFGNYLAMGTPSTDAIGTFDVDFFSYKPGVFTPTLVPEPSTLALLGLGLLGLFLRRRG